MGCFAAQTFTEGNVVWFYYGTLIYDMILIAVNVWVIYKQGVMDATCKLYCFSAMSVTKQVLYLDGKPFSFWLVRGRFANF